MINTKGRKILVICGPTAVGKTGLALHLAKKFQGELVSADSRQVYIGMDIGTGKDLPKNAQCKKSKIKSNGGEICYYEIENVEVWGYDLVSPKKGFSVADYTKTARKIVENIWDGGKLPILVGGSGFYIKGLVDGIQTSHISQDLNLRVLLDNKKVEELFEMLTKIDPVRGGSMNVSDRNNPRRLVRAIEVAMWNVKNKKAGEDVVVRKAPNTLFVCFTLARDKLNEKIEKRVDIRVRDGIEGEVKKLIEQGVGWEMQAMNTLGYKEWRSYFEKKIAKSEVVEKWKIDEKNYAKRQMTWFKRDKRIHWFDVEQKESVKLVENLIQQWYSSRRKENAKKD